MHSYAQIYLPRLQSYQNELLQRLELLVNIDSGTGQIDGINCIISHLEQWLSDIGFDVTLYNSTSYGNNLVARRVGRGHLRLLLVGHVDTVYPRGAAANRGRSAVIELAHKMIAIHHLNSVFPGVTFNVTRISSSEPLNVVPDSARCHISVRAFNQRGLDLAATSLDKIAAGCSVPDTQTRLTRTRGRVAYEATPQVIRLVEIAQLEAKGLGIELISETKGGVSDANLLMEVGVPTLDSLGPVGGGMHDLNREHLRVDSIALRGALLAGLIHKLCLPEATGTNHTHEQ